METVCKATLESTLPPDVQEDAIHNKACTVSLSATAVYVHVSLEKQGKWEGGFWVMDRPRLKKSRFAANEDRTRGEKRKRDTGDSGGSSDW